ncbi:MAG: SIS domain-containing protein [Promethearchaeota archaeon]
MDQDIISTRFYDTMLEIASQVKMNAKKIQINDLINTIDAILQIYNHNNMIFIYGAGRSGFIGRCFAQRLMHLGLKSCFISDAITYQYTNKDLLFIISGSGETTSSVAIAQKAKEIGGKIWLLSTNPESTIAKISTYTLIIAGKSKNNAIKQDTLAPYTSLFDISTLAVLDSIGGTLMKLLDLTEKDINQRHASIE